MISHMDHESNFMQVASKLHQCIQDDDNAQMLDILFTNNHHEVMQRFGGLRNMICLCLSHPDAAKHVDMTQLLALEQLLNNHFAVTQEKTDFPENNKQQALPDIDIVQNSLMKHNAHRSGNAINPDINNTIQIVYELVCVEQWCSEPEPDS